MLEVQGNLWTYSADWRVITTNGFVRSDGKAVMGRGVALQAAQKFPKLAYEFGGLLKVHGNHVMGFPEYRLLTMPVKHNWYEKADLELIERSCQELKEHVDYLTDSLLFDKAIERPLVIAMVRPGCGNGQLNWIDVKPLIEPYLDDRFVVVEL